MVVDHRPFDRSDFCRAHDVDNSIYRRSVELINYAHNDDHFDFRLFHLSPILSFFQLIVSMLLFYSCLAILDSLKALCMNLPQLMSSSVIFDASESIYSRSSSS